MCVEHDEDAGHGAAAHRVDHALADGREQGQRVFVAAVERVNGDIARVDERLRSGVDLVCERGEVLRREHLALQIALAVLYLLLQQVRHVLFQLNIDAADIQDTGKQRGLDQKDGEHRAQDRDENRPVERLFVKRFMRHRNITLLAVKSK